MKKTDEIKQPFSCLNKAYSEEHIFVLLSRDRAAPAAIHSWIKERIRLGLNEEGDDLIRQAKFEASKMEEQYQAGAKHAVLGDLTCDSHGKIDTDTLILNRVQMVQLRNVLLNIVGIKYQKGAVFNSVILKFLEDGIECTPIANKIDQDCNPIVELLPADTLTDKHED